MTTLIEERARLVAAHGYTPCPAPAMDKVGIARNVRSDLLPINGLRMPPLNGTTGWYFWAGPTMSKDPDFFVPLHVAHLAEWCPQVLPYLELPPGWRFIIAPDYEDVWFDETLLLLPKD